MGIKTSDINVERLNVNRAIGGGLDFWQRGTSFSNAADFIFLADRFQNRKSAGVTSTINITQEEDTASDSPSQYSMKIENSGVSAALGVNDICAIRHSVEGNMIQDLYSQKINIQFKVKANHTATYGVSTHNATQFGGDSLYETFSIDIADEWETKIITFDISSGTYEFGNGIGVDLWFTLASGSNLWLGDAIDNFVGTSGNTVQISDVMIYDATHGNIPFQRSGRNYAEELQLCMRYFEKSYDLDIVPGSTGTNNGREAWRDNSTITVTFAIRKRDIPVVTPYSPATGTAGQANRGGLGDGACTISSQGESGFEALIPTSDIFRVHWIADSEL